MTDTKTLREVEALKQYLKECDDCQIVPDVGGSWAAAWKAAIAARAQGEPVARDVVRWAVDEAIKQCKSASGCHRSIHLYVNSAQIVEDAMRAAPQPAAQPVRQPLTERAILDLMPTAIPASMDGELLWFARALERAHGIGQEGGAA